VLVGVEEKHLLHLTPIVGDLIEMDWFGVMRMEQVLQMA
jgi:hypothetical protein